jgi:hypothetical protein
MHLILIPLRRIATVYAAEGRLIAAATDGLLQARAAAGIVSRAYDPQEGLPELGIAPVELTPGALVGQLVALQSAFAAQGAIIDSLTIIGGPQVVPFGSLPNPLRDGDDELLSDCVYGLATADDPLVHWPVGRLPDADPLEPGLLVALIAHATGLHQAAKRRPGTLGYTTERWQPISAEVLAAAPAPRELLVSPPLGVTNIDPARFAANGLIYCNLHGVRNRPFWYGQARDDTQLVPALRPEDLTSLVFSGAIVVSQACFGARLSTNGRGRALALGFLSGGARCMIGALVLTYGAISLPIAESDLLVQCLFQQLFMAGMRVGEAFQAAHAQMLREAFRRQGFVDGGDTKTLLTFVLYGDPTLPVEGENRI